MITVFNPLNISSINDTASLLKSILKKVTIDIAFSIFLCNFEALIHHEMENKPKMVQNRIKAELAEQQKTNHWLAQQLGKGDNTISRWCSNKIQPSLEQLGEVAKILNVDIRDLIRPTT